MKRLLAVALSICIVGSVFAQSSFTIVRPADGSKVREKVRIMIPTNSLNDGEYVGVFLNGKFVEAVVPPKEGNYRVYTLDTKMPRTSENEWRNGIPDGEAKLELVKYTGGEAPRISDRSSVTVTVGNHMNIDMPAGGVHLRYGFRSGQQLVYDVHEMVSTSTRSGSGVDNGGRAASFPEEELSYRMLYAIDNTYANGDALLRYQNVPDKGKDYSILALVGIPEPQQVFDYQMMPIYMRVDKTARPVFGAVPEYFGFSAGSSPEGGTVVFGGWPLPVLPDRAVTPGSNWRAQYLLPLITIEGDPHLMDKVAEPFDARGEFVAAEWELGHPCAKIRNSIAVGTRSFSSQQLAKAGQAGADDKVGLEEMLYFSLDTHKILKLVRTITIDHKEEVQTGGGGVGGPMGPGGPGGTMGPAMGPMGPMGPGVGPGGPAGKGGGGGSGAGFTFPQRQFPKGRGGQGQLPMPGGGQVGPGMGVPGNRGGGGGATTRTQIVRQTFEQTFILEQ